MKKTLLMLFILMISNTVYAQEKYSEYELIGYTNEAKEETDLIKYEKTQLNYFYKEYEENISYNEKIENLPNNIRVDLNDYKEETTYNKEYSNTHYYTLKYNNSYKVSSLYFYNFNTGIKENHVYEIEVYNQKEKIDCKMVDYVWLNDGNLEEGRYLYNARFSIDFYDEYELKNLEIVIYYKISDEFNSKFSVRYMSYENVNVYYTDILLDNNIGENKKSIINIYDENKFNEFVNTYNLLQNNKILENNRVSYYSHQKKLYKYCELKKTIFILDTELPNFVNEDYKKEIINLYKILKREKIEAKQEYEEEQIKEKTNIDISNKFVSINKKYPAVVDTTKNELGDKIEVEKIQCESTKETKCQEITKKTKIKKYFKMKLFLIFITLIIFTKIIQIKKCKV